MKDLEFTKTLDGKKLDSAKKTDESSLKSKISNLPFPITMKEAEERILESEALGTIFSPNPGRKSLKDSILANNGKVNRKVYESPINKKLKLSVDHPTKESKHELLRGSLSSLKPSKGDQDTESDIKIKRTVFNDYKE